MGKKKLFKDDGVTEDFDAESKEIDELDAAPGLLEQEGPFAQTEAATETAHTADESTLDAGQASAEAPKGYSEPEPVESESPGTDVPELKQEPAVAAPSNPQDAEGLAPKTTDEKATLAATDHTPAELEPSQANTPNAEPAPSEKDEDVIKDAPEAQSQVVNAALGTAVAAPVEAPQDVPATRVDEPKLEVSAPEQEAPADFGDLHGDVSDLAEHLGSEAIDELKKAGNAMTPAVQKLHGIEAKLEHLGDEAKARFVHAKMMLVNAMGALERLFSRG